jgi:hypothetical protein
MSSDPLPSTQTAPELSVADAPDRHPDRRVQARRASRTSGRRSTGRDNPPCTICGSNVSVVSGGGLNGSVIFSCDACELIWAEDCLSD